VVVLRTWLAVRHLRSILGDIRRIGVADSAEVYEWAKRLQAPVALVQEVAESGRLPVPLFCAGGIATPADASLVMQLGAEAVFVGSGIFKSEDPSRRARAIVEATTHYRDAGIVAKVSAGLGEAMPGQEESELQVKLAERGW
jgi:pyridoxal 5'-phosphate synthase pdxS subunit